MADQRSIRDINQEVLDELEPGDRVDFDRGPYDHCAIYIGGGRVIHKAGDNVASGWSHHNSLSSASCVTSDKAEVKEEDFWVVAKGCKAKKNNENDKKWIPRPKAEIVKAAKARVGEREGYNIFNNNCETFVNECRYGKSKTEQGTTLATGLGVGGSLAVLGIGGLITYFVKKTRNQRNDQ